MVFSLFLCIEVISGRWTPGLSQTGLEVAVLVSVAVVDDQLGVAFGKVGTLLAAGTCIVVTLFPPLVVETFVVVVLSVIVRETFGLAGCFLFGVLFAKSSWA